MMFLFGVYDVTSFVLFGWSDSHSLLLKAIGDMPILVYIALMMDMWGARILGELKGHVELHTTMLGGAVMS